MTLSIKDLVYSGDSISVTGGSLLYTEDVAFKPDGLKMYVIGLTNLAAQKITTYDLSTAWDITSATINAETLAPQNSSPKDLTFKSDGVKMYIADGGNTIDEYTLSGAWDVSSATFIQSLDVSVEVGNLRGINVSADGMMIFVGDRSSTYDIRRYSTSGAWSLTGGTFDTGQAYAPFSEVTGSDAYSYDVFLSSDGFMMYVLGNSYDVIYEYTLGTAWDLTTVSYGDTSDDYLDVTTQDSDPGGFWMDESHIYLLGSSNDYVYQYDFPITASFTGTVSEEGSFVARTVRAYSRITGALVQETTSNGGTGEFTFDALEGDGAEHYIVILDDDAGDDYNALVFGRIVGV